MDRNDQRIMLRRQLDRALCQQALRIIAGEHEFAGTLQRDQRQDELGQAHAACRSATQLAVKPGPSAVSKERDGRPCCRARSSTNKTVGADMLPQSAITCRSWSSVP